jgi:hypothetical protein
MFVPCWSRGGRYRHLTGLTGVGLALCLKGVGVNWSPAKAWGSEASWNTLHRAISTGIIIWFIQQHMLAYNIKYMWKSRDKVAKRRKSSIFWNFPQNVPSLQWVNTENIQQTCSRVQTGTLCHGGIINNTSMPMPNACQTPKGLIPL